MGIDPERAPSDPFEITPESMPPLLDQNDSEFQGSIPHYFSLRFNRSEMMPAPSPIKALPFR